MKIGIVGLGCVGSAYASVALNKNGVAAYDIREYNEKDEKIVGHLCEDLSQLVAFSDLIILTLPTPTVAGKNDLSAYEETLEVLSTLNAAQPIVIKSTITPNELTRLTQIDESLKICYSPEFLTEHNATDDLLNNGMHFVADANVEFNASETYVDFIENQSRIVNNKVTVCDGVEMLSLMKYCINVFLTTKVSFFNGVYALCQDYDIDYNELLKLLSRESRLGSSHMQVPGPDGKRGYGGMCFPKDIKAFTSFVLESPTDVDFDELLKSVEQINKNVRG